MALRTLCFRPGGDEQSAAYLAGETPGDLRVAALGGETAGDILSTRVFEKAIVPTDHQQGRLGEMRLEPVEIVCFLKALGKPVDDPVRHVLPTARRAVEEDDKSDGEEDYQSPSPEGG